MASYHFPTGLIRPVFLCLGLFVFSLSSRMDAAQATGLPIATLTVGDKKISAEVAATKPAREHGLMGRDALAPDHGMLFVFDHAAAQCFWMKNTPLALSIAFITTNGFILSIDTMAPFSETVHCPPGPILYALEMRQGWFARAGIVPGMAVGGLAVPGGAVRTHKR